MRRIAAIVIAVSLMMGWIGVSHAQVAASSFDACAVLPKQSAAINISSATDTQLVALQANNSIFLCGYVLNQVNGTGSLQFEYGSGSNCGTGKTALSGPIFASTAANGVTNTQQQVRNGSGTQLLVPAGKALCALSTGTIQQSGWITYVQSPQPNAQSFFDPCWQYPKQSAAINFSSATTTALISPASTSVYPTYICNVFLEDAGRATTANTTQFEYGTKASTDCDTGATALTGPYTGTLTAGTTSAIGPSSSSGTDIVVPAGKQFCAVTSQSSTVTGYVTYVSGR